MVVAQLAFVVERQLALCHLVLLMSNGANTTFIQTQSGIGRGKIVLCDVSQIGAYCYLGR